MLWEKRFLTGLERWIINLGKLGRIADLAIQNAITKYGSHTPFIIVPFDEGGKIVRSVLNITYGITETALMDLSPGKGTVPLSMLEKQEYHDAVILLASCDLKTHDLLLSELDRRLPADRIVDVFAERLLEEADLLRREIKDQRLRMERTRRILRTLETAGGLTEAFCYHPKHTQAAFYLPFVVTDLIQGTIFDTDDYYEAEELHEVFFGIEGDWRPPKFFHLNRFRKRLRFFRAISFSTIWNRPYLHLRAACQIHKAGLISGLLI